MEKHPIGPSEPRERELSRDAHIKRHKELHRALDELAADYIRITGKLLGQTDVLQLLEWSHRQTENPETEGP